MSAPTFVPHKSEGWSDEEWTVFRRCYPEPSGCFGFDGDDYCNDGDGGCEWDGQSRRCNCGNRRVYWCFEGSFVYPEVY